jgi:hypothetical protein
MCSPGRTACAYAVMGANAQLDLQSRLCKLNEFSGNAAANEARTRPPTGIWREALCQDLRYSTYLADWPLDDD